MASRYSAAMEAYIASVVAVGGDWPARVANLRNTYPNNEAAFRGALEKQVLEAHSKAKAATAGDNASQQQQQQQPQQGQQQQQQSQHQYSAGYAGSPTGSAYQQPQQQVSNNGQSTMFSTDQQQQHAKTFPGGRSYPGQQQAPAPPAPSIAQQQYQQQMQSSNPQSLNYIPYARDDKRPAGPMPTLSHTKRQGSTSTLGNAQMPQSIAPATPGGGPASAGLNQAYRGGQPGMNTGAQVNTAGTPSGGPQSASQYQSIAARPSSALNPAILRQPKIQPQPVAKTRDPLPPYFPISTGQAYLTTYPSRVKLGLTSVAQPISASGAVRAAQTHTANMGGPSTASRTMTQAESSNAATLGKRQRSKIDYTERLDIPEPDSDSEEDDEDEDDEDEAEQAENARISRAQRAAKRGGLAVPMYSSSATPRDSPNPDSTSGRKRRKEKDKADVGGGGRTWLGLDPPGELIMAQPARRHILPYVPENIAYANAQNKALLVPVRIELDTDTLRIRDTFMWNPNESTISPETFARIFCLDIDIPFEVYGTQITSLIKTQVDEYSGIADISLSASAEQEEADLRCIVNLDVQIGTLHIIDRIEWDITSSLTPEAFARKMCAELGMGGEAIMVIAHNIHEELLRLKKDCLEHGYVGGSREAGSNKGPKKLESIWRDWNEAKSFVPHFEMLAPEDVDICEGEKDKNPRRLFRRKAQEPVTVSTSRVGRRR